MPVTTQEIQANEASQAAELAPDTSWKNSGHIAELDGLRAIAIVLVLVWHYFAIPLPERALFVPIKHFLSIGRSGVDLFFVLSGFLITRILIMNRNETRFFSVFYARRALRIWPPYIVLLIVFGVGYHAGWRHDDYDPGPVPFMSYVFFVQNFFMSKAAAYGSGMMSPTWSLAVEEQFYLVFPLFVRFLDVRALRRVLIAAIIIAPLGRAAIYLVFRNHMAVYTLMPLRADALAVGGLIAIFSITSGQIFLDWRRRIGQLFAAMLLASPLAGFAMSLDLPGNAATWGYAWWTAFYGVGVFTVIAYQGHRNMQWLRSRIARGIALISYSAYLFHTLILHEMLARFLPTEGGQKYVVGGILIILSLAITVALTAAMYVAIERHCIAFGKTLKYHGVGPDFRLFQRR